MNNRLQRLQEAARERYQGRPGARQANYLKKKTNARKAATADYRALLAGQGLVLPFLAISYRPAPGEGGIFVQGAWKQFRTSLQANSWLFERSRAGSQLYQGKALYSDIDQVLADYEDPDTNHAVWLAISHYLQWRVAGLV